MDFLSAHDIIRIWETGKNQRPPIRALTILSAGLPEATLDQLAGLTIGRRDGYLLNLREGTFGPTVRGLAECPRCSDRLEFALSCSDLAKTGRLGLEDGQRPMELDFNGIKIRFRLPCSSDLVKLADREDVQSGRKMIFQRCILETAADGKPVPVDELPEDVDRRLAALMAELDPGAEIILDFHCPGCGHAWQTIFDIASFIWTEISAEARRLLQEVHALASAYKWRETDILSMSSVRRKYYLDLVA